MKLQAVMENLQRQQRARLQLELESQQQQEFTSQHSSSSSSSQISGYPGNGGEEVEPERVRIQRAQMAALAAMRAAAAVFQRPQSPDMSGSSHSSDEGGEEERENNRYQEMGSEEEEEIKRKWDEDDFEEDLAEDEYDEEEMGEGLAAAKPNPRSVHQQQQLQQERNEMPRLASGQERLATGLSHSSHTPQQLQTPDHGDWTYEEQFKQLYELDSDPKRKEFLDDLFSFMQKRGTPVNRIPIMAKQVLDLYMLYVLVTEKGGLVEVINKKLWREITKGLNLPTSITSAAFTLRTQYMKYLYPYECEKRGLSNPNELQAAIDSNRREGRRQAFGGSLFTYSPSGTPTMLSSPKLQLGLATTTNGSTVTSAQKIKKGFLEEDSAIPIMVPARIPVSLASHSVVAAQAAAVQAAAAQAAVAAQAAALEQLREKLESGEPPEKKGAFIAEEQQRLMQRAIQQNLLAMTAQLPMNIRINTQGQDNRQESAVNLSTNGMNSISMSVELNGIVYTGVLFAQTPATTVTSSSYSKGNASRSSGTQGASGMSVPHTPTSNNSSP
uniref:AT-rich interactive domain-containing protein 3 n=1 Tax=Latimeria chalumnae TaxID=7897 RepID=H3B8N8_LATCH